MTTELKKRALPVRAERWNQALQFARFGSSVKERLRLFYYTGLKPSLVFRGWRRYSAERIPPACIKAGPNGRFQIYARDNGLDMPTFAEFFVQHHRQIPPDLPPRPVKVFYDLGANIGAASLYFSTQCPTARFYGFEPLPSNYEICVQNYRNLPGSQVFPWAVGARSAAITFECPDDPRGGRIVGSHDTRHLAAKSQIEVEMFSISDLMHVKKLEPPDFVKMDVEGAEYDVLEGIAEHWKSIKRLFIETHGAQLKAKCAEWLKQHGYRIYSSADPTALWADQP